MNEIITRALEENLANFLAQFPAELISEDEQEIVTFVLDFSREYGKTPSVKRVMEKFEYFIPFRFAASSWEPEPAPIGDIFNQTVKRKLLDATERLMREASVVIKRDGEVPLETFNEIERLHTMSLGVSTYSKFDRDLYFRRTSMHLPFKVIDANTGGISDGDFMLLIGRLGTGKSTVAQYMAKYIWEKGGKILFVSAEMLSLDVFSRIDAMVGKFNPLELRLGKTPTMVDKLTAVHDEVKRGVGEIIVPRSRLLNPAQIAAFAKNLGVDLIIVDGAYLLQPSSGGYTSKWEKVANVSNELKQMALELNLPLVATAQIKRGADGDDGYTPEDIALSDALGQDADFVVAVYPNKTIKERAELQLIKNRYGSTCATQIYIDYETMTIIDETVGGAIKGGTSAIEKTSVEEWKRA